MHILRDSSFSLTNNTGEPERDILGRINPFFLANPLIVPSPLSTCWNHSIRRNGYWMRLQQKNNAKIYFLLDKNLGQVIRKDTSENSFSTRTDSREKALVSTSIIPKSGKYTFFISFSKI